MASVYDFKPRFQALLRPLVIFLANRGVSANQVTVAALLLSLATGGAMACYATDRWPLLLMPAALLARMALNAIDGMLAREHDMKTALGGLLNELGDALSDAALYLPLAWLPGVDGKWVVLTVILAILSEMTGVIAVQVGASRRYDGPMGKSDRALVIGLFCLLLGSGGISARWFNYALIGVVVLLGMTIVNRARRALAEIR